MDCVELQENVTLYSDELQSGNMFLSLSVSALGFLNDILNTLVQNKSIINMSNSTCDQFLLINTVQRLKHIRLCPGNCVFNDPCSVNLSNFTNLKSIELKRINAHSLIINQAITQLLEKLICIHVIETAQEVFRMLSDNDSWIKLSTLEISHSKLDYWPSEIFLLLPSLISLNVKHNRLTRMSITGASTLKHLDASYNLLSSIPSFSVNELPPLKTLFLNRNLICDEGLDNLRFLETLEHVNLADNLIEEVECLSELNDLAVLKDLDLNGNPLSYQKQYRKASVKFLHENACLNNFLFDGKNLSREERMLVGTIIVAPNDGVLDQSFEILLPSTSILQARRSARKSRDVLISESSSERGTRRSLFKPESTKKHLETKVQIKNIRNQFGEDRWLQTPGGSVLQYIIGLNSSTSDMVSVGTNCDVQSNSSVSVSNLSPSPSIISHNSIENSLIPSEVLPFVVNKDQEEGESILPDNGAEEYTSEPLTPEKIISQSNDLGEGLPHYLLTAIIEPENRTVFIVINDSCFKEVDSVLFGKVIIWPLKNVTSCSQLSTNGEYTKINITFNSIRPSQTERSYSLVTVEAMLLLSLLREKLESRPWSDMNQIVYSCIKCSTVFAFEKTNNNRDQKVRCQTCGSNAVLELEEPPLPAADKKQSPIKPIPEQNESNGFMKSPSQSSIGSANSLKAVQDVPIPRKCDSDIEVISNPSLSSVEVLEVLTRKKSSEERQLVAVPQLVTVPEQNTTSTTSTTSNLTESSSSGSLTDSICTAYDGSRRRTIVHDDNTTVLHEEDEGKVLSNNYLNNLTNENIIQDDKHSVFINGNSIDFSYSDFGQVDHRLKHHLLCYFKNNEEFVGLLKSYFLLSKPKMNESDLFSSKLLVFSTVNVYIFQIEGLPNGDSIDGWLKLVASYSNTEIQVIRVLPFKTGFNLCIKSKQICDLFILTFDPKCTSMSMSFLKDFLENFCEVQENCQSQEKFIKSSIASSLKNENILLSSIVPLAMKYTEQEKTPHPVWSQQIVGVIISESMILLEPNCLLEWLNLEQNINLSSTTKHSISSLVSIEKHKAKSIDNNCYFISLNFEIENEESIGKETWKIGFATKEEKRNFINVIKHEWEKLFEINLNIICTDVTS